MPKQYIGDGVYVDFDGYQLELTTERENGTHVIYMEPGVWNSLMVYVDKLNGAKDD